MYKNNQKLNRCGNLISLVLNLFYIYYFNISYLYKLFIFIVCVSLSSFCTFRQIVNTENSLILNIPKSNWNIKQYFALYQREEGMDIL